MRCLEPVRDNNLIRPWPHINLFYDQYSPWMHYCRFCDNKRVVEQTVGDNGGFASDEDVDDDPDDEDVLNDY